jgi:hypothetical protein
MDLENNSLKKTCDISQHWRNRLKKLEPILKDYVNVDKFDLEETEFNFEDAKANEFFSKCQQDKIVNEREWNGFKREYKVVTFKI